MNFFNKLKMNHINNYFHLNNNNLKIRKKLIIKFYQNQIMKNVVSHVQYFDFYLFLS